MSAEPRLDALFQALADPTRRSLLSQLARGPASVSDLAQPFDMALPSLMGHLRKLEDAGLIETRKDGRVRTCAIVPEAFTPVRGWLDEQRALWEGRLDRLDDYVTRLMKERQNGH
ncbi:helix-turn-helix transcriptional regulator [Pararhodobacter sp. CCB-MM2]|uniref:ArsR/SmtB family transcription factor n=1 Tax=Pararhodobacter sp. CCB-MM2 TaxID=1786003 RepID=UPI0008353902|nr:metalloregulator ArsR/SmtB family transcription factor [Pararhodobacter sp. CCB-MM2]MCA2013178.1 metalloregulator ArsR/SmtB family transcription factor [Cereibacter sphaeroides]